jgi:hypothetical protein
MTQLRSNEDIGARLGGGGAAQVPAGATRRASAASGLTEVDFEMARSLDALTDGSG